MRAMVLEVPKQPLKQQNLAKPKLAFGQILLQVHACGVCRTDLHIVDGELEKPKLPLVPGHEIVGTIVAFDESVHGFGIGQRVGVPWLGDTCRHCQWCLSYKENLCDDAVFTGYLRDGGYAEYTVADHRYCFSLPEKYGDAEVAPLLCAGLIGWRSLKLAGDGKRIGLYGFGAAAHILIQVAIFQKREVFVFTRPGDTETQAFAKSLGAAWVGDSVQHPPALLDAAIIFAPLGSLVPIALQAVNKGGSVVCGGIHMDDIPCFPYQILWGERIIRSVANLTRQDAEEFLSLAAQVPLQTSIQTYPLEKANQALNDLRKGQVQGAAVLLINNA